jgi:transcriptional regulator with GAF, ATPase, and Fis domain
VDALVRDVDARGFVIVQASSGVAEALSRHVERRARVLGRQLVKVDGLPADDAWRELAARFPLVTVSDPLAAAQAVLDRAGAALMLVREGAPTCWGRAFADELSRLAGEEGSAQSLVLVLREDGAPDSGRRTDPGAGSGARVIEVEAEVSPDDLLLWWDAAARDAGQRGAPGLSRLDAIEGWWSAARATPVGARPEPVSVGPEAGRLLARITLSQRSWLGPQITRLGTLAAAEELVRAGALVVDAYGRLVGGTATVLHAQVDVDDRLVVAGALEVLGDPWGAARASELYAEAGAFDGAEAAAVRAVAAAVDASARADFWRRWQATLAALPEIEAVPRLLRSAELALRGGDVELALELAGAALSRKPESFATLLTLGRANVARGDFPTAACWLGKALAGAQDDVGRAMVEVELAEVRQMEGDIEGARRFAESALAALSTSPTSSAPSSASRGDAATRLHARNVLGKIMLATSAWQQAEAHFAADACEAALSGDRTAELRARLNRSIAMLSSGRPDEARSMLMAILAEGEAHGELHAVAYALANLAIIAIFKREYAEALHLSERAFEVRRRIGEKTKLALHIANLAELKLLLGQVSEAEQSLAFGRKACGPGMPGARAAHFAYTAALIHLERRRTADAALELRTALSTARGSGNGSLLGECHRLAARIALEDGDLVAAEVALEQAAALADTPRGRAWVAVLEASRARAAGETFDDAAAEALACARAADDPELVREAHVLSHHAAVVAGSARGARAHLEAAVATRDQIAEGLPVEMRRRYLMRRDLGELGRLEAAAAAPAQDTQLADSERPPTMASATLPSGALSQRGEGFDRRVLPRHAGQPAPALKRMVGRAPAMLALGIAIQKVGASDATVLVHGESGTGKELVAEAIHEASPRRTGPIVKVNCAALVETLLLSELFGHEKGAFTGAAARRRGRFEVAEGGTLFLDEIGDISPRTQVALLRVLQERTFERVGGVTSIRANVRIICATHRDLPGMVARGEFREDLYYRLRGVVLEVPSLRQRLSDLPVVAGAILDRIASERGTAPKRLSAAALEGLTRHNWPGNVRELENALRAAALFAEGDALSLDDFTSNVEGMRSLVVPVVPPAPVTLPGAMLAANGGGATDGTLDALDVAAMTQASKSALSTPSGEVANSGSATDVAYATVRSGLSLSDLKRDIERECIARALAETGGNITRAAGLLGMKRPRLSQLVKQYGFGAGGAESEIESEDGE